MSILLGVVSRAIPLIVGSMLSDRATLWDASNATTSSGEKSPPSFMRANIWSADSWGPGIIPSGAGAVAFGRPSLNSNRGAPGQLVRPTAVAK